MLSFTACFSSKFLSKSAVCIFVFLFSCPFLCHQQRRVRTLLRAAVCCSFPMSLQAKLRAGRRWQALYMWVPGLSFKGTHMALDKKIGRINGWGTIESKHRLNLLDWRGSRHHLQQLQLKLRESTFVLGLLMEWELKLGQITASSLLLSIKLSFPCLFYSLSLCGSAL